MSNTTQIDDRGRVHAVWRISSTDLAPENRIPCLVIQSKQGEHGRWRPRTRKARPAPAAPASSLLGMIGPAMVLAARLWFFGQWWTPGLMYTGLAFMVGISL